MQINSSLKVDFRFLLLFILSFSIICYLNNLVPFYALPTLGQAFWATGFAQSIANGPFYSLHAANFGYPYGANISFGLSAVFPLSLLLRAGIDPANGYIFVFIFFLLISFCAAYNIACRSGLSKYTALLLSSLWLVTPVIIQHANYSMLSLGMALLPFYYYSLLWVVEAVQKSVKPIKVALYLFCYSLVMILSVFMDGYTFVIIAILNSFYVVFYCMNFLKAKWVEAGLLCFIHAFALIASYLLYVIFIGKSGYEAQSLDFFRSWGVDLSFLIQPTTGIFLLPDILHLSTPRSELHFYGDSSVWRTSYILPMLVCTVILLLIPRLENKRNILVFSLFVFIFSLYLSLGPSLKFYLIKPAGGFSSPLIPESVSLIPTGSGWISEHVPGFNVMRASYRWIALSFFMLWLSIVVTTSTAKHKKIANFLIFFVLVLYIPRLGGSYSSAHLNYQSFDKVEEQLILPLGEVIKPGEVVAFVPWNNDFLINYVSSRLKIKTFNIGGDKNLQQSMLFWPENFTGLHDDLTYANTGSIINMLSTGEAKTVVIPYFDMLWSAHVWPCKLAGTPFDARTLYPDFKCPDAIREKYHSFIDQAGKTQFLNVTDKPLFALLQLNQNGIAYPVNFSGDSLMPFRLTGKGWYLPEKEGIWSSADASLQLPRPSGGVKPFTLRLNFNVFSGNSTQPKRIYFKVRQGYAVYDKTVIAHGGRESADFSFTGKGNASLSFHVMNAASPGDVGLADKRVLGMFLTSIESVP